MKQIMLHGADDWRLDDIPEPEPGPRDALVRIAACGICGTDTSYIHMGMTPRPSDPARPRDGRHRRLGGQRRHGGGGGRPVIVCPSDAGHGPMGTGGPQGGLTPVLHVPEAADGTRLFPVPDGMPLTTAALAEPLAVGMQSVNQSGAKAGDKVVVFGCGPIGLMALATLADRGVTDTVAVDLSPARLELAKTVGAAHVIDPTEVDVWEELKRIHGTSPFMFGPTAATDIFIEASGADSVIGDVLQNGRVDGTLVIVALHYRPVPTSYVNLLMKQFTVRGSMEYPERFEDAVELLGPPRPLRPHHPHLPLEGFGDGLAVLEGSKDCGKVMITIGDTE